MQAWTTGLGDLGDAAFRASWLSVRFTQLRSVRVGRETILSPAPPLSQIDYSREELFLAVCSTSCPLSTSPTIYDASETEKRNKRLGNKEEHAKSCTL